MVPNSDREVARRASGLEWYKTRQESDKNNLGGQNGTAWYPTRQEIERKALGPRMVQNGARPDRKVTRRASGPAEWYQTRNALGARMDKSRQGSDQGGLGS